MGDECTDRVEPSLEDERVPAGSEYVDGFIDHLVLHRGLSPNTARSYKTDLTAYLLWAERAELNPIAVTHRQLRRYLAELDAAQYERSTINRHLSALRTFFRWLNTEDICEADPASSLSNATAAAKLPNPMSSKDVCALLDVWAPPQDGADDRTPEMVRDHAVLEFLYATGCRISEASNLVLADVDTASGIAKVMGKGSKERVALMHSTAIDAFDDYLRTSRPVLLNGKESSFAFVCKRGGRLTPDSIRKMFKRALSIAGVSSVYTPHSLRHAFATDMLDGGADLRSVQELLGHSSLSTTQIYTHVSPAHLKAIHTAAHPRA